MKDEKLSIQMRCASSGAPFRVFFQRTSSRGRYHVVDTRPGTALVISSKAQDNQSASGDAGSGSKSLTLFDWSDFVCPICDFDAAALLLSPIIKCGGCRSFVCGGTLRRQRDGTVSFACHYCGRQGQVGGTVLRSLDSEVVRPGDPSLPSGERFLLPPGSSI